MYGTIAKLTVKKGQVSALKKAMDQTTRDRSNGRVSSYAFQLDSNPDEVYLVAIFKDKETYRKNAEREDTHQNFLTMMKYLEKEPEWNDGKVVYAESA